RGPRRGRERLRQVGVPAGGAGRTEPGARGAAVAAGGDCRHRRAGGNPSRKPGLESAVGDARGRRRRWRPAGSDRHVVEEGEAGIGPEVVVVTEQGEGGGVGGGGGGRG